MSEHGFSNIFQIFNSNKDTIVTLQVTFTRYMIDYRESEREGPGLHEGPSFETILQCDDWFLSFSMF